MLITHGEFEYSECPIKLQCSEVVLDEKLKTEATAIGVHWDLPIVTVQNRYWYAQQLLVHAVSIAVLYFTS